MLFSLTGLTQERTSHFVADRLRVAYDLVEEIDGSKIRKAVEISSQVLCSELRNYLRLPAHGYFVFEDLDVGSIECEFQMEHSSRECQWQVDVFIPDEWPACGQNALIAQNSEGQSERSLPGPSFMEIRPSVH